MTLPTLRWAGTHPCPGGEGLVASERGVDPPVSALHLAALHFSCSGSSASLRSAARHFGAPVPTASQPGSRKRGARRRASSAVQCAALHVCRLPLMLLSSAAALPKLPLGALLQQQASLEAVEVGSRAVSGHTVICTEDNGRYSEASSRCNQYNGDISPSEGVAGKLPPVADEPAPPFAWMLALNGDPHSFCVWTASPNFDLEEAYNAVGTAARQRLISADKGSSALTVRPDAPNLQAADAPQSMHRCPER